MSINTKKVIQINTIASALTCIGIFLLLFLHVEKYKCYAATIVDSGTETSFEWTLDSEGVLNIVGSGSMQNYSYANPAPWGSYNMKIKSVIIDERITEIGDHLFYSCGNIQSVTMSDDVTRIGNNTFSGCTKLDLDKLPDSLTELGESSFSNCTNLDIPSLPNGITEIKKLTFTGCKELALTSLPNGVTSIGMTAFNECINLSLEQLPSSLKTIGNYAFSTCPSLKLKSLPEGLETIGNNAFDLCVDIEIMSLPESLVSIGNLAFSDCDKIEVLAVKSNSTTLGTNGIRCTDGNRNIKLYTSNSNFNNILWESNSLIADKQTILASGTEENINWVIGSDYKLVIGGRGVIQDYESSNYTTAPWYARKDDIHSVCIGNGVERIGEFAFYDYPNVNEIIFEGEIEIGENAFGTLTSVNTNIETTCEDVKNYDWALYNRNVSYVTRTYNGTCGTSLNWNYDDITRELIISGTGDMTNFANYASTPWWPYRMRIKKIKIDSGVKSIGNYAFNNCVNLESVVMADSVQRIGYRGFRNCYNLKDAELSPNITSIGGDGFFACYKLFLTSLPEGIKKIENSTFPYCYNMALTKLPDSLEEVGEYGFNDCYDIRNITLPANLKKINNMGFIGCCNINFPSLIPGTTYIGNSAFAGCRALTITELPSTLTTLGTNAFANCHNINISTLPNSITILPSGAFDECYSIENFIFPNTVTKIENFTFYNCNSLKSIEFGSGLTTIEMRAFLSCNKLTTITGGNNVTNIGVNAFYNTPKTVINLDTTSTALLNYNWTDDGRYFDYQIQNIEDKECIESEIEPSLTVKTVRNVELIEGTDYDIVSYTNNVNAGTATVCIKGIGNYAGTKYKNFTIKKITGAEILINPKVVNFTGNIQTIEATTTNPEGLELEYKYYKGDGVTEISKSKVVSPGTYYVEAHIKNTNYDVMPKKEKLIIEPVETKSNAKISISDGGSSSHMSYMSGYSDGTFRPSANITREEMAAIISKIDTRYNSYDGYSKNASNFSDVKEASWATNYIGFTKKINIINGYADGTYKPKKYITRGEMAAVLAQYKKLDINPNKKSKFKDVQGRWLEKYVAALEERGYVNGIDSTTYGADKYITRAEACAMINNILERTPDRDKVKTQDTTINKFKDVESTRWYYADIMEASNSHPINIYN